MPARDTFLEKITAQLESWDADIDQLQVRTRKATADVRIEYEEQVANLKGRRDALKERLAALEQAGEEGREALQQAAEKAAAGLSAAFARARSRFSVH